MFGLASGFYENYFVAPEVNCLIVGLDGAGKTTLLERLKVTDFRDPIVASTGKRIAIQKHRNIAIAAKAATQQKDVVVLPTGPKREDKKSPSRRRRFTCPAPRSYSQVEFDSDEEIEGDKDACGKLRREYKKGNIIELSANNVSISPPISPLKQSSFPSTSVTDEVHAESCTVSTHGDNNLGRPVKNKQYDLKAGKTMLPSRLIRPTLGMNLGKFEACGARIRIMDLGGTSKMRPLWERYYKDVNCVIFVIDTSPSCEVSKLMEARAYYRCMRDDESLKNIPILIFANKTDTRQLMIVDRGDEDASLLLGDTSLLDIAELFLSPPRGLSDPEISKKQEALDDKSLSMFAGSATTGQGVAVAFDWLIRCAAERARRMQKRDE